MRRILLLLCLLLPPALRAEDANPFAKEIRLDAWGAGLPDTLNQIMEQSVVDIRTAASMGTMEQLRGYRLYLPGDRVPVYQAIEWIAKAAGCRYYRDGAHSVVLTCGYETAVKESPKVIFENIETLVGPDGNPRQMEAMLQELTKPLALLHRQYYLRVEEQKPEIKLVAALPETMAATMRKVMQAMTQPGAAVAPENAPVAQKEEIELFRKLNTPIIVRYQNQPLRDVLQDLSLQTGLQIALDGVSFPGDAPAVMTLDLGQIVAREALEKLGQRLGLAGRQFMLPQTVWLTSDPDNWTPSYSRRVLWDELKVESYHVRGFVDAVGGGGVLAHTLRKTVATETWKDPVTGLIYHEPSGNLIVVAPAETQRDVMSALCRMKQSLPAAAETRP